MNSIHFHNHGDDDPLSIWFQEKETWFQVPQTTITSHVPTDSYLGWSPSLEFWTLHDRKQHIEEKASVTVTVKLKVSSRKNNYPFEYNNIIFVYAYEVQRDTIICMMDKFWCNLQGVYCS